MHGSDTFRDDPIDPARGSGPISDEDLAAEALAAPETPLPRDAVPFAVMVGSQEAEMLPAWYMPTPMGGGPMLAGWRRSVVIAFVASLLLIEAFGLCTTYGQIV